MGCIYVYPKKLQFEAYRQFVLVKRMHSTPKKIRNLNVVIRARPRLFL